MPILTPNFSLPYPAPTDEPCLFAEQWCDFATRFNEVMDGFQATVDRTYPTIPIAMMRVTTPVAVNQNEAIPFDTVDVNTANYIDFDVSNTAIRVTGGGWYTFLASITFASTGATTLLTVQMSNLFFSTDRQADRGTGTIGVNLGGTEPILGVTDRRLTVSRADGGASVTVQSAIFSSWWHSDTATP